MREFIILLVAIILLIISIIYFKINSIYFYIFIDKRNNLENKEINHKSSLNTDYVLENTKESKDYITDFAIKKEKKNNYLLCKYKQEYSHIKYNVLYLTKNDNISSYITIDDYNHQNHSRIIKIPKSIKKVAFQILKVNGNKVNELELFSKINSDNIVKYSLATMGLSFSVLYFLRLIIALLLFKSSAQGYFHSLISIYSLIIVIVGAIIIGIINLLYLRHIKKKEED